MRWGSQPSFEEVPGRLIYSEYPEGFGRFGAGFPRLQVELRLVPGRSREFQKVMAHCGQVPGKVLGRLLFCSPLLLQIHPTP